MARVALCQKLVLPCLLLCLGKVATASHMIAVEIRARPINCTTRTYEITLIGYVNTSSMVTFGGDPDNLSFGDGESVIVPAQLPVVIDPIFNVGRVQYTIVHTYASAGTYILSYTEHARNEGIMNMDNSALTTFYTESSITINESFCDSPPYLTVPPIDRACSGIAYYHNPGAIDRDDDSLSFSFVAPKQAQNTEVTNYLNPNERKFYSTAGINYNQGNEGKSGIPIFIIDPIDGTLSWDAPGLAGEYALAIKITGWRLNISDSSWVESGYSIRDMQVIVEDCNNRKPDVLVPQELCVTAGEKVEFVATGSDPDGDPVVIEAFSDIFDLQMNPGEVSPKGAPSQSTSIPYDTANLKFKWNTTCLHIKNQSYKVVIKITDSPPAGPRLVQFKTVFIKVIGPSPEFDTVTVNPLTKSATLKWKEYPCENLQSIQVWRRVSKYEYDQPECQTGMPALLHYQQIASLPPDADSYLDADLAVGAQYCYRIVALTTVNKIAGRISLDTCLIPKPAEAPVITNVSINETSQDNGSIEVRWTSPFDLDKSQYPPPYLYKIYRATDLTTFVETTSNAQADTSFTDTGLNTTDLAYLYRIELYVPALTTVPVDTSSVASSVFLEATPLPGKVSLSWHANTPWYNYTFKHPHHLIYRSVSRGGPFTLIDSVNVNENGFHYIDSGKFQNVPLAGDRPYYYKILTRGSYGNPSIDEPLENFSQIAASATLDIEPPCSPIIAMEPTDCKSLDCSLDSYYNQLTWSLADNCLEEGLTFRIFVSDTEEGGFEPLVTVNGNSFLHENLVSLAKCYRVAAIDAVGNISALSAPVCNDNCPYFELPNVFTPGSEDGFNDLFHDFGSEVGDKNCSRFVKQIDLTVFNRWGEKVYSVTAADPVNKAILWDGSSDSGKDVESGIYFYSADVTFDVRDVSQQKKLYKGWVHLIRNR